MEKTIQTIVRVINHYFEESYQASDFPTTADAWRELEQLADEDGEWTAEDLYSQYYEGL